MRGSNVEWMATGIYGPCPANSKQPFFDELEIIRGRWSGSWYVCGDFNEIVAIGDRSRDSNLT